MKTDDILNLDCEKEKNKQIIIKCLQKIDFPKKIVHTMWDLEKMLHDFCKKEGYRLQPITITYDAASFMYVLSIVDTNGNTWVGNVYGKNMWELFAKGIIKAYSDRRRKKK